MKWLAPKFIGQYPGFGRLKSSDEAEVDDVIFIINLAVPEVQPLDKQSEDSWLVLG